MSPRKAVEAKARRYLGEGRITVELADRVTVRATVRGRTRYRVDYCGGVWRSDCPAVGGARTWRRSG